MVSDKTVYTVDEVVKLLGVNRQSVYKLVKEKSIPSFRPSPRRIIIPKKAFEEWLCNQTMQ